MVAKKAHADPSEVAQAPAPLQEAPSPCFEEASTIAVEELVEIPLPLPSPPAPTPASTPSWPPTLPVLLVPSPVAEARP